MRTGWDARQGYLTFKAQMVSYVKSPLCDKCRSKKERQNGLENRGPVKVYVPERSRHISKDR